MPAARSLCSSLALLALAGCLDARVSDEVVPPDLILPANASVPSIYDTDDGPKIEAGDGVDGTVPLESGFAGGRLVRFWDFGPAPDHVVPLFRLVRRTGDTVTPLPHPPIFSAVPGDVTYSPYWLVYQVEVTDKYQGELITSAAALNQAQARGLVGSPHAMPGNVNCPVVGKNVKLEVGGDNPPLTPNGVFYYEGHQGFYFDFGASALAANNVTVPTMDLDELRREGGDPVSEPVRGVDLDGDGDVTDTNDVFPVAAGETGYSPRCQIVEITVPASTALIDTTQDQARSDVKAQSDLTKILGIQRTDRIFNCPQQRTAGGL